MTASALTEATETSGTRWSGIVLGVGLPVAMFFASRSAPLVVALAAGLACLGIWQSGLACDFWKPLRDVSDSLVVVAAAFVLLCAASVCWTHFRAASAFALGEALAAAIPALVLGLAYRIAMPANLGRMLAYGLSLAALATVIDLQSGMWFRHKLGIRPQNYVLNRTVVTLLLLAWPMLLLNRSSALLAGGASVLVIAALMVGESSAAQLGLLAGVACAGLAVAAPRLTILCISVGTLVVLGLSPWIGTLLRNALPDSLHRLLAHAHSDDRVNIWMSFGAAVEQRPWLGSGFGSSARMADDPVAGMVAAPLRTLLGAGHPHNALLQVWVELGVLGAIVLAGLLVLVAMRMMRLAGREAVVVAGLAGTLLSIAAVSHGAWQGWWIADAGAAIAIFAAASGARRT